jgi:hypothetical protein
MGLGVYFSEDIAKILAALSSAGDRYGPEYHKALTDVAMAVGVRVSLPMMMTKPTVRVVEDQARLLAAEWD